MHTHAVWPFASTTNSADIPHFGSACALFGLVEREQNPFGLCGCTAHVSLLLECTHTKTRTFTWEDMYSSSCMHMYIQILKLIHMHMSWQQGRKFTQVRIYKHTVTHAHTHTDTHDTGQSSGLIQASWRPIAFHGSWLPDILSAGSVFSAARLVRSRRGGGLGGGWRDERKQRERWWKKMQMNSRVDGKWKRWTRRKERYMKSSENRNGT